MEEEVVTGQDGNTAGALPSNDPTTIGADPNATAPNPPATWNPQDWQYSYKGQAYTPQSKDHLLKLAEKGHAFAQRLEEINRQEEAYRPYKQLDAYFKQNPDLARKVAELYQSYQAEQTQSQDDPNVQRLSQIEQWMQVQQERDADRSLAESKQRLMDKYKDYDWNTVDEMGQTLMHRVMKHALETGVYELERVFRDLMWDEHAKRVEANGRKGAAEALQQAHKAGIVEPGKATQPGKPPPFDPSKHSWDQVGKMAIAEITKS